MKKLGLLFLIMCLLLCSCNMQDDSGVHIENTSGEETAQENGESTSGEETTQENGENTESEVIHKDLYAIDVNGAFVENSKYTILQTATSDSVPGVYAAIDTVFYRGDDFIDASVPAKKEIQASNLTYALSYRSSNYSRYTKRLEHYYQDGSGHVFRFDENGMLLGVKKEISYSCVSHFEPFPAIGPADDEEGKDREAHINNAIEFLSGYTDMNHYVFDEYIKSSGSERYCIVFQKKHGDLLTMTKIYVYVSFSGVVESVQCLNYFEISSDAKMEFDMEEIEDLVTQRVYYKFRNWIDNGGAVELKSCDYELFIMEDGTPALRCEVYANCTRSVSEEYYLQFTSVEEYVIY